MQKYITEERIRKFVAFAWFLPMLSLGILMFYCFFGFSKFDYPYHSIREWLVVIGDFCTLWLFILSTVGCHLGALYLLIFCRKKIPGDCHKRLLATYIITLLIVLPLLILIVAGQGAQPYYYDIY